MTVSTSEVLEAVRRERTKKFLSLEHAKSRPGVTQEELDNLNRKLDYLDVITWVMGKEVQDE